MTNNYEENFYLEKLKTISEEKKFTTDDLKWQTGEINSLNTDLLKTLENGKEIASTILQVISVVGAAVPNPVSTAAVVIEALFSVYDLFKGYAQEQKEELQQELIQRLNRNQELIDTLARSNDVAEILEEVKAIQLEADTIVQMAPELERIVRMHGGESFGQTYIESRLESEVEYQQAEREASLQRFRNDMTLQKEEIDGKEVETNALFKSLDEAQQAIYFYEIISSPEAIERITQISNELYESGGSAPNSVLLYDELFNTYHADVLGVSKERLTYKKMVDETGHDGGPEQVRKAISKLWTNLNSYDDMSPEEIAEAKEMLAANQKQKGELEGQLLSGYTAYMEHILDYASNQEYTADELLADLTEFNQIKAQIEEKMGYTLENPFQDYWDEFEQNTHLTEEERKQQLFEQLTWDSHRILLGENAYQLRLQNEQEELDAMAQQILDDVSSESGYDLQEFTESLMNYAEKWRNLNEKYGIEFASILPDVDKSFYMAEGPGFHTAHIYATQLRNLKDQLENAPPEAEGTTETEGQTASAPETASEPEAAAVTEAELSTTDAALAESISNLLLTDLATWFEEDSTLCIDRVKTVENPVLISNDSISSILSEWNKNFNPFDALSPEDPGKMGAPTGGDAQGDPDMQTALEKIDAVLDLLSRFSARTGQEHGEMLDILRRPADLDALYNLFGNWIEEDMNQEGALMHE
ncbi:MAG TPA: hypothetical protein H9671_07500 [Firmicutes bacterium]|nr:hypothetical protein [Bacillota bacterium]